MKPIIRPAKRADVIAFRGEPYSESFKGIVTEMDGRILGIAGVMYSPVLQAFSSITDEMRKHPKTIIMAVKEFRKILEKQGDSPIYAMANQNEKNAPGFLSHVGFEYYKDGVYRWQTP